MDSKFAEFYLEEINRFQPCEIISNSNFTKFIFKNHINKKIKIIYTVDNSEINSQINSTFAETAPSSVIEYISKGQYIICNENSLDNVPDGHMWPLFIRPAKEFLGQEQRFFIHISERPLHEDQYNR